LARVRRQEGIDDSGDDSDASNSISSELFLKCNCIAVDFCQPVAVDAKIQPQ
jgi:hypothetical protein